MTTSRPRRRRNPVAGGSPDELQKARSDLGMTIAEVAAAVQVSDRSIGSWERGDVVPSVGKVGPLLRYYEAKLRLLHGEELVATMAESIPGTADDAEADALRIAEDVTRKDGQKLS